MVEDNAQNAEWIIHLMQRWDYTCKWVNTGQAALDCIAKERFDLVLLDIVLPDMPGYELIPEIKAQRPKTKIIVMTGQTSSELEKKVRQYGITDYWHKPFGIKNLKTISNFDRKGKLLRSN